MDEKSKEHLQKAMYHLAESLQNNNSAEIIMAISDSLIDIASYIEKWEGRQK
jgi:phosphoribosylanthranilate isomerase